MDFPPCPQSLRQIQHFLKLACEHDSRDVVVAYWSRLYALQVGLKLSNHGADETKLLVHVMDWLETAKEQNADNEAITNEVAAQAHIENYALKLFLYADRQDRESNFGKNVVKAFYSSGVLYDVLRTFGELSEEALENCKYAKWKAAYIHNCLKNGETPVPGPLKEPNADDAAADAGEMNDSAEQQLNISTPTADSPPAELPAASSVVPPTVDEVLRNPSTLPSPPVEEEKPGGFVPYVPPAHAPSEYRPVEGFHSTPEQIMKAQKFCKHAASALNYDDVKTAVENLQKALMILTTGRED